VRVPWGALVVDPDKHNFTVPPGLPAIGGGNDGHILVTLTGLLGQEP